MVENVRKAIKIDEHVMDSLTTSMVDDGFNVLQHCCCRWISTSNIHSVIAALSSAVSLLGGEYNDALQQKMREPNLGAKLFLGGVGVQKTGIDIATALNNMDVSSEYALSLRHEVEEQCAEIRNLIYGTTKPLTYLVYVIAEIGDMNRSRFIKFAVTYIFPILDPKVYQRNLGSIETDAHAWLRFDHGKEVTSSLDRQTMNGLHLVKTFFYIWSFQI
ncbi:conserved oligomeric Golgi complex subunit 4 [Tanacetum coccineum]